MLNTYFDSVLDAVRNEDEFRVLSLLGKLREPNETHLGISKGRAAGRALGPKTIGVLAKQLSDSKAARTGLIEDLEDTALFIEGVGKDIVSDITTNIIRGMLIAYTGGVCEFYGIPTEEVPSGFVWNPLNQTWEEDWVNLPVTDTGKLLLTPKVIVRTGLHLTKDEFFSHHLTPALQNEELEKPGSKLVQTLKDGSRHVNREDIRRHYGNSKSVVESLTVERPNLYLHYKSVKCKSHPERITHEDFDSITGSDQTNYYDALRKVLETPLGSDYANQYHSNIEALMTTLFYPQLSNPIKECEINEGRKRVDIRYTNTSDRGFFSWLRTHQIPCKYIFMECKNYSRDLGNPELDQISSRFSPLRGTFGIISCRSFENKELFLKRCRDTALDQRGYIVLLDDSDLIELVESAVEALQAPRETKSAHNVSRTIWEYPLIQQRFDALVS
ncbi:hypothetical protein [Nocardiopsis gilva]|uniref:hypothetical protein n=1 Tax=Nocardiopsis gilva TaxID=280236 RepID=UPI001376E1BB|nr:hypothetical protein [Nocardiopsis gilva]